MFIPTDLNSVEMNNISQSLIFMRINILYFYDM